MLHSFLLASSQIQTHSLRLSLLPSARQRATTQCPPFISFCLAVLPLSMLILCHSSPNISGFGIFHNFFLFFAAPLSPKIPDSAPPLSKPLSLAVSSRMNAARLCQCQVFANRCICVPVWVWWKAPDLGARVVFKSEAGGLSEVGTGGPLLALQP